ncbi:MAG: aminotransferase class V-fold PLP-dependent enzyme, partial [Firmicutes bacterium]|nr:aminotransferase class V-fold PLP-dependent enzyme [Bacillota bacterium]
VAALVGAAPQEVAFGANTTSLIFQVSRALSKTWQPGDEIILTELDHHGNIDPWRLAAEENGLTVKYIPLNTDTLTLDLSVLPKLLSSKTRLLACGAASNGVGTITDISLIAKEVHKVGAYLAVDAVHAVPHFYLDMKALGADMLFCSAYKFFGPHVGIAVISAPLFANLPVYKVIPAPDSFPDKLETGTQNHEGIAGVSAAIDFIAGLGYGKDLARRIQSGYKRLEAYENALAVVVRDELARIPGITLYQALPHIPKTPTIAFRAAGHDNHEFCRRMCDEHGVFIADGDFYACAIARKLGIDKTGAFIRLGLAPYNTLGEVKRFLHGVRELMK